MKLSVQIFAIVAAALLALSLWTTAWVAAAGFAVAAAYFAWNALRQAREVSELLRDPAFDGAPFDEALSRLRQRLREGEQGLREREAEIAQRKQITNAVPDGLFLLDRDHRIVWCNQAALVMHSLDAFRDLGKPIGQLIRTPEFLAYLDDAAREAPIVQVGGRSYAMRLEEAVDGARLLLTRDVTDRERLDRMRRDFVANVSHELRTPLTVVGGYVETLRDLPIAPDEQTRYFDMIATQTANMLRLVEDLLILARLENDSVPIEVNNVALHSIASDALADARALSGERHAIDAEIVEISVKGNANELRSAISNLLSNSVRYTPSGGSIRLCLRQTDAAAAISVSDTGVGIAPEHLPRLSERFYRVDRSRSRETGGTGLGLAIVKHVAQRHRGTLTIESAPGRGSTFTITLPRH